MDSILRELSSLATATSTSEFPTGSSPDSVSEAAFGWHINCVTNIDGHSLRESTPQLNFGGLTYLRQTACDDRTLRLFESMKYRCKSPFSVPAPIVYMF